jgi:hypothetical protein
LYFSCRPSRILVVELLLYFSDISISFHRFTSSLQLLDDPAAIQSLLDFRSHCIQAIRHLLRDASLNLRLFTKTLQVSPMNQQLLAGNSRDFTSSSSVAVSQL